MFGSHTDLTNLTEARIVTLACAIRMEALGIADKLRAFAMQPFVRFVRSV